MAYAILRIFAIVANALPRVTAIRLGELMGMAIGPLARKDTQLMRQNLRMSLRRPPTVHRCWADLGRRFVEFLCASQTIESITVEASTQAIFDEAMLNQHGVLVATAHIGHWELMAAALARRGYPILAMTGQVPRGPLGKWLRDHRAQSGIQTAERGGGARRAIKHLERGKPVALFVDQSTRERGEIIEFMGQPAPTSMTYARLLELSEATPIFVWNVRHPDGHYVVKAQRIPTGASPMPWLNRKIGEIVAQNPTQWVWIHDRWNHGKEN